MAGAAPIVPSLSPWSRAPPNLTVRTNALVTRVLLSGARATGVELFDGAAVTKVHATGEVILCGGSLNSPHLLMLSGIGPAGHLREHGVDVIRDMPGTPPYNFDATAL